MKTLFVDTSTTGLWHYPVKIDGRRVKQPEQDQPYMSRIAWLIDSGEAATPTGDCFLIQVPDDLRRHNRSDFDKAAFATGIFEHTQADRRVSLEGAISRFIEVLDSGIDVISAYNWPHHSSVIENAFWRLGLPYPEWPTARCTQHLAAQFILAERREENRQLHIMDPGEDRLVFRKFVPMAQRFAGDNLVPSLDAIGDGYRRVNAVREIYLATSRRR